MKIDTIRDNLINTINCKMELLEKYQLNMDNCDIENNRITWSIYYSTIEFLKININELNKILEDIETAMGIENE